MVCCENTPAVCHHRDVYCPEVEVIILLYCDMVLIDGVSLMGAKRLVVMWWEKLQYAIKYGNVGYNAFETFVL